MGDVTYVQEGDIPRSPLNQSPDQETCTISVHYVSQPVGVAHISKSPGHIM